MNKVIIGYSDLTNEILNLLVERFPDGYDDSHIIRFKNAKNELIEAVEVRTEDTIYLVKVTSDCLNLIKSKNKESFKELYAQELKEGIITEQELTEIENFLTLGGDEIPNSVTKLLAHCKNTNELTDFIFSSPDEQQHKVYHLYHCINFSSVPSEEGKTKFKEEHGRYIEQTKQLLRTRYFTQV